MALPRRIRIDEDGRLTSEEGELREFLELFSGSWRIESVGRDLLVLVPESEAPENAGTTMLSGRIAREGRLVDIIGFVSSSRWSGTLTVHSGRTRRQLFFDKGALRMASSSEASDRLGELMHRLGMITRNQLEEAVEGLRPDRRIGEVLIDKGAATASIVYEMIHRQVEELFFATLVMNDGVFTFTSEIDLSELPAYISLDTNNLLLEGVRRLDELEYFHKLIPGPNIVLQRKSRSFPPRLQEEVEDVFLGHCDGRRTLGELAETTGLGEYEATRLAYQLLQEGALEVIPTESTRDDSLQFIVGRFNDMIDRVVETVDAAGFGQPFLLEMRAFPLSGGEFQDCTERLDLDEEGHLDYDNVVEILADTDVEDRMSYIVQVLTQYVFYCLFLSDRYLTRDTHRKLGTEVHTMLQKIGA